MKQINEYNTKTVNDTEFNSWRQQYTSGKIPDNIMQYMLDKITASDDRMEAFYNDCMQNKR